MKLLFVDDEKYMREYFTETLQPVFPDIDFLLASNGEEGLRIFYDRKPDIVVLDIKMPGLDGLQVLQRIKSTDPYATVIMFTAYGDFRVDSVSWLADDYLAKTPDFSELIDRINFFIKNNRTKNRIFQENFPFPIAYNLVALRSKINAKEILDTLFHLTEFILKYLICLLLAENINSGKDITHLLKNYRHTNLTLGRWYELLMVLAKLHSEQEEAQLYIPELRRFFYQAPKRPSNEVSSFQKIIQIRNELHQRPFPERHAEKVASEIREILWRVLDKCIFFKDYVLQVVESAMPDSKGNMLLYYIKYLIGSHPEFLITQVREVKIYPYRQVFLKKIDCSDILVMHPFIIFEFDPLTHRDDVFIIDKMTEKTVYKSSQQGHLIEKSEQIGLS